MNDNISPTDTTTSLLSGNRRPRSPSNQVRINAARVVYSRWRIIFFWSSIIINFIQLSITVAALIASAGQSCDSPLRAFLIIYALLVSTNIGTNIYQYGHPATEAREISRTGRFVKSLAESTDFVTIMSYILGNIWLSSAKTCPTTAPVLYFTSLAWVIWGYCLLLLPIIALACIILCLPCFIILFNILHLGSPFSTRQGASEAQIGEIPEIAFTADVEKVEHPISVDDARCSICLSDYQENDPLRILPCEHHFHKACVDQWLGISATCPLCVQTILQQREEV